MIVFRSVLAVSALVAAAAAASVALHAQRTASAFARIEGRAERVESDARDFGRQVGERADRVEGLLRRLAPWASEGPDPGERPPLVMDHNPNVPGEAGYGTETGDRPPVGSDARVGLR